MKVLVVGAGVFGVTAALELRARGHEVTLADPGPLPHPLAESTDISKIVRLDYGADEEYTRLMEQALEGWRRWNTEFEEPLLHKTGLLFVSRAPLAPGGFEFESLALLTSRGHRLERLDALELRRRYPAWNADRYVDGYYNPTGGWAESGRVVGELLKRARGEGVTLLEGARAVRLIEAKSRVTGVELLNGNRLYADEIVLATGSWITDLVPRLNGVLRAVGQPVFHLRPQSSELFAAERFPTFGADISQTGYYGFPVHPNGLVKVANHGVGRTLHPDSDRRVTTDEDERQLREFLRATFPALADAPIAASRVCVYGDSRDEHFWIARDPERCGLSIAAGGSGHGFKFAPVLGGLIADAVERIGNPALERFRWRQSDIAAQGQEAARHRPLCR